MFTGIVEQVGTVVAVNETEEGRRLTIAGKGLADLPIGASIAVNGVCLTAVEIDGGRVSVDMVPETLARTNLGGAGVDSRVNLERPMPASGRFDGHIVQGHVDGTGLVTEVAETDGAVVMTIQASDAVMRYVVEKGSITVDGVSLTVAGIGEGWFSVALIPHTLEVTSLGLRREGDTVNLEVDVLAKYVEKLLEPNT